MIKNTSRNKVLVNRVKVCESILSKCKGLMFSKRISDKGLVFVFDKAKKWSIHMLFVLFPIDVLWLDEGKKVVDMRKGLRPFVFCAKPKSEASFIVELPTGAISRSNTIIGDKISF